MPILPADSPAPGDDAESVGGGIKATVGVAFVLLSALAFGSTPAFASLAFTSHISGLSLVAFRCLIAAGVLWGLSRVVRESALGLGTGARLFALGALLFGPQMALYFAAVHRLDTSITVAVVYIYPAIVAALTAVRLRRFPPLIEMLLLVLALVGVGVIALVAGDAARSTVGLLLAVSTAVIFALYVIASDVVVRDAPPIAAASLVLAGAGVSASIMARASGQLELPQNGTAWLFLSLHGLILAPIGVASYYAGLKRLGATRASIVDTSQPAIAAVIGVVALGERLTSVQILGMIAIVFAVIGLPVAAAARARRRTEPARGPDVPSVCLN